MIRRGVALAVALLLPTMASARDYCSTRPSLGNSACLLDPGRIAIETAISDWERSSDQDELLLASSLLRVGLSDRIEAQVEWQPLGIVRDRGDGRRIARGGDVTLGARINLRNPDGSGFSYGLQPSLTLPVGRDPVGEPGWRAGVIVPIGYDLREGLSLRLSPQVETVADADGWGRHWVPTATLGLEIALTDAVEAIVEGQWLRDAGTTEARAAAGLSWGVTPDWFLDAGTAVGLTDDTPSIRVQGGVSYRF